MLESDVVEGVRDVLPFLPGFVPLGIVTGVAARNLGMGSLEAILMSILIFAGTAQLTAMELLAREAPVWVAAASALMLNLRLSMFTASVEPYLRSLSRTKKWVAAFLVSTPAFVLSVARFQSDTSIDRQWYYFGAATPMYLTWVSSTAAGALLGARIPPALRLDFVLPLVFIAILFKLLDGRGSVVTAVVAGLVAVLGTGVPFNLGVIVATAAGVGLGLSVKVVP